MNISELKYDGSGLIPAVIQDEQSGEILMLAYMNAESLQKTVDTGFTHFWSRSRQKLWKKGETSGNTQKVREIRFDCDSDTLLITVAQKGVACHTGSMSCFANTLYRSNDTPVHKGNTIARIYDVIMERKKTEPRDSYVSSLFKGGKDRILKKVGEEAAEVIIGSKNGDREEIIWEVADLWFHTLVLLGFHDITPEDIYNELEKRFGKKEKSGLA